MVGKAAGTIGAAMTAGGLASLPKLIQSMPEEWGAAGAALAVLAWMFWLLHTQAMTEIKAHREQTTEVIDRLDQIQLQGVKREGRLAHLEDWLGEIRQDIRELRSPKS